MTLSPAETKIKRAAQYRVVRVRLNTSDAAVLEEMADGEHRTVHQQATHMLVNLIRDIRDYDPSQLVETKMIHQRTRERVLALRDALIAAGKPYSVFDECPADADADSYSEATG